MELKLWKWMRGGCAHLSWSVHSNWALGPNRVRLSNSQNGLSTSKRAQNESEYPKARHKVSPHLYFNGLTSSLSNTNFETKKNDEEIGSEINFHLCSSTTNIQSQFMAHAESKRNGTEFEARTHQIVVTNRQQIFSFLSFNLLFFFSNFLP